MKSLEEVEAHFRNEFENWGFIADEKSFEMIFNLIELAKELEGSRLTALNRHYLHEFFDGDVMKMQKHFNYITE